jgi:hypothetical protein
MVTAFVRLGRRRPLGDEGVGGPLEHGRICVMRSEPVPMRIPENDPLVIELRVALRGGDL